MTTGRIVSAGRAYLMVRQPPYRLSCHGAGSAEPDNHLLSRTLRARDNGAADTIRCLHGAKRRTTTRIKPTPGEKAYGFLARRGLSAAPLGERNKLLYGGTEAQNHGQKVCSSVLADYPCL